MRKTPGAQPFRPNAKSEVRRQRILVVDDEDYIRHLFDEYFTQQGYEVVVAANGKDALSRFGPGLFDCVVSDILMPEMDGIELLRKIKDIDEDVSILMITGYPAIEGAVEAIKLGAYDYISKPLNLEDIAIKVDRALYMRQLEGSLRTSVAHVRRLLILIPILLLVTIGICWVWFRR
jgi:DNA-binding NtrC family response regulator